MKRPDCMWQADIDPCADPAVDFIERRGKRRWFCAKHFDLWQAHIARENKFWKDLKAKKAY